MYHVYNEYNALPKLHKIDVDDIFKNYDYQIDEYPKWYDRKVYGGEHVCLPEIKLRIMDFLVDNHPELKGSKYGLHSIPEDIVIHRTYNEVDWLAYANVSFPNGWSPEKSIGKSFNELHSHIPGINLTFTRKMLQSCIHKGPFERFVWGIYYENKFDHNSDQKHLKFEDTGEFYVKVERQVIVGFPEFDCFMFILRPYFIDPDIKVLYNTLTNMTSEQRSYKGITQNFLDYLKEVYF